MSEELIENTGNEESENINKKKQIVLQLGDVIRIKDPLNEKFDNNTFYINYIDNTKIKLVNVDSLEQLQLRINEKGVLGDGTIETIGLLSRNAYPGFAMQNGLVPSKWINIVFGGDIPAIITGEITNLEQDMIEVRTYPEKEIIYINFDYKGIPEDIPIESITIRDKPEEPKDTHKGEEGIALEEEKDMPELEKDISYMKANELQLDLPISDVKNKIREFIVRADQIKFGKEEFAPVKQLIDVDIERQRYSIEAQTSDLLDDMLSTIPNSQRTPRVLNNIHTMIERFKQLRENFSSFDEYGNVKSFTINEANYKPLVENLMNFNTNLYWILPVVKNIKKIYNDLNENEWNKIQTQENNEEKEDNDYEQHNIYSDLNKMDEIVRKYKSSSASDENNKYSSLYIDLDPYFTPFSQMDDESKDVIYETQIRENINVIINNLENFYSSVVNNNIVSSKRYLIQKYNLGLNKLQITDVTNSRLLTKTVNLTDPDVMSISSIITLPEPVIRFSRVNLPGTNILDRANLSIHFLNYWKFFKQQRYVSNTFIDSLEKDLEYTDESFANKTTNFVLNVPEEESKDLSRDELYKKYSNSLVPKIKTLFNLMKKYINGKLSIVDVISYLEPFLVYTDNLTYKQYEEIIKFISEKISDYNKRYVERSNAFMSFKRTKGQNLNHVDDLSLFELVDRDRRDDFSNIYDLNFQNLNEKSKNSKNITTSELLSKITLKDFGNLYNSIISNQNIKLTYPDDFTALFDKDKQDISDKINGDTENDKCNNLVFAKRYNNISELGADNGKEIYFDKKFDKTNYSILDNYEKDMIKMSPDEFIPFLHAKLKERFKLSDENAEYLSETLINGHKKVKEGQYATTADNGSVKNFIRKGNNWVLDDTIDYSDTIKGAEDLTCDLKNDCIVVSGEMDKCESIELNKSEIKQKMIKSVISEFDAKYKLSKEELLKITQEKMEYNLVVMSKISRIETSNFLKYNNQKIKMADSEDTDITKIDKPISPFSKILDAILGQKNNFEKKQYDIIKFADLYTRPAFANGFGPLGTVENEHWHYCIKTNVELLPSFISGIAGCFIYDRDNYNDYIDLLCKEIGTLNEDGDSWVDKHSGRVIKKIDYSNEEGWEEGFRVSSRSIMDDDIGNKIVSASKKPLVYDSIETKMISNVVNALSVSMGITIEEQKPFIINCVTESLRTKIPKEDDYKKTITTMANKGKKIPSFEELYNSSLLYYTLGMFLISVQTVVPSIRTRKTFPGCVRSFSGYPFEGSGDLSALNYLACVAYNIRKTGSDPWRALSGVKETTLATRIKAVIDGNEQSSGLIAMEEVKRKIDEKTEYLLINPVNEIPPEHDLSKWTQFLPPLIQIKIRSLLDISPEFKSSLISDLKHGAHNQREKILVIESKIIQFSLAIQEKIQGIIKKKNLLLLKANNEPYVENSCCNENKGLSTLEYFENEDTSIHEYNAIIKRLSNLLFDINSYSKCGLYMSSVDTKNIYPAVSNDFNDEIKYLAFIKFCNFSSLIPISEDVLPLCKEKPENINENDSSKEIIVKLKEQKIEYSDDVFLRLLQVVNRNSIIDVKTDNPIISSIRRTAGLLERIDGENDSVVEPSLRSLISSVLDTFETTTTEISEETKALNNFLIKNIESMKDEILGFITINKSKDISKRALRDTERFLNGLSQWETNDSTRNETIKISDDKMYNIIEFFKTNTDNLVNIFPNIILNSVNYKNVSIPSYWGLSGNHNRDVSTMISEFYEELRAFYNDNSLYNILKGIQRSCKNLVLLSKHTTGYTSIKVNGEILKPVYDERTSNYLFEFYFLRVLLNYIELADMDKMIVTEATKDLDVDDLFSVDFLEDVESGKELSISKSRAQPQENILLRGNKVTLKQKVSKLLVSYIKIMGEYKKTINISYEQIQDKVFKIREREKDGVTDRLKFMTDEERDADTILKINKLGVWNKSLQKGLTTYVADTYDDERQFMENMLQYERTLGKKPNVTGDDFGELMEEVDREHELNREAYDMGNYIDDYNDGNFEGDEVENRDEFDS
uniref:Uncharacterized protein n=1 Tax=viral metagenome TaxID=1070528 RepID=A0A6C0IER2_9ZZZZ